LAGFFITPMLKSRT